MANPKLLKILKQGVEVWNQWRKLNPETLTFDLTESNLGLANLIGANLENVNLNRAFLSSAKLSRANLKDAVLMGADLRNANLDDSNLRGASFLRANLGEASLQRADLRRAELAEAHLTGAKLTGANLSEADLKATNFTLADLSKANLNHATLELTIFGNNDLTTTIGLAEVFHRSYSTIDPNTIQLFRGEAPTMFLRGCGLSDWEIETAKLYNPYLSNEGINKILYKIYDIRAQQSLQISPLFISYSHSDTPFVDKLENYLIEKGIRFWRDIHQVTVGRLEKQIDSAIRHNPTVLLILSESSIKSDWVEHEVRFARELEKEMMRDVLCPIALDQSWKTSSWPKRIMEQVMEYHILDFSEWNSDSKFERNFDKLIQGLNLFYN